MGGGGGKFCPPPYSSTPISPYSHNFQRNFFLFLFFLKIAGTSSCRKAEIFIPVGERPARFVIPMREVYSFLKAHRAAKRYSAD